MIIKIIIKNDNYNKLFTYDELIKIIKNFDRIL